MLFKVIRASTDFNAIAKAWNDLLSRSASHVPFLRHEYLSTWWDTLGGGEWSRGELFIVLGTSHQDELVGIAPLFFTENKQGEPALMLLGSIEISDYLDLIVPPENLQGFLDSLLEFLDGPQAPDWRLLDWYNLPEESLTLPTLERAARSRGWQFRHERLRPAPCVQLPGDWQAYLASLDKKQRHEIRRKLRRAENYEQPVRWYILESKDQLDRDLKAFLDLMAQDPQKDAFLTGVMRSQMRAAVHAAFQAGWLQLSFLEVGGEKAAGYLNFDYANRIWVYNSGWDARFGSLSPGWVLLAYLLRWANDHQRAAFDFMRGGEDYKYRFGGTDRYVVRATVRR
jgi:CelD/BcsL family acetyltransferase involved in cellulose biosynthesis